MRVGEGSEVRAAGSGPNHNVEDYNESLSSLKFNSLQNILVTKIAKDSRD